MTTPNSYRKEDAFQLSAVEMGVSIIAMLMGVGILTLPRELAEKLGNADGWISVMLSGLLIMAIVYLYIRLQRHFPGQTLLQYIGTHKWGKWLAKILGALFVIYFICGLAFILRMTTIVLQMYLLPLTPTQVTAAFLLLTTSYAVSKGTQGIIHLNIMFVPFILVVLFLILAFNLPDADFTKLLPVFADGLGPVLAEVKAPVISFLGIEILFFFMASMKSSQIKASPISVSIGVVTFFYVLLILFSNAVFGIQAAKLITFPTMELAKEVEIPGAFFERTESLTITVWMMAIFNTLASLHLLAVKNIKEHFIPRGNTTWITAGVTFIAFIIAFIPNSITGTFIFGKWASTMGMLLYATGLGCGFLTYWIGASNTQLKA